MTSCDDKNNNYELAAEHTTQLKELEEITRLFLSRQFSDSLGIWNIQKRLLLYQSAAMSTVTNLRKSAAEMHKEIRGLAANKPTDWQNKIITIQSKLHVVKSRIDGAFHRFALARRMGDAYVWTMLGLTTDNVLNLSDKRKNSPPPDLETCTLMSRAAELLASPETGFPILHDISNILTIGDVTLVRPSKKPITIELKIRNRKKAGDRVEARVSMHSIVDSEGKTLLNRHIQQSAEQIVSTEKNARAQTNLPMPEARLVRQLERLRQVAVRQNRVKDGVYKNGNEYTIIVNEALTDIDYNYDALNSIVADAARDGYAGRAADNSFYYFACRRNSPFFYPWSQEINWSIPTSMPAGLASSGIFSKDPSENAIVFQLVNSQLTGKGSNRSLPFYLLPLPLDAIIDIVYGRLLLFVFVNPGSLAKLLRAEGLSAEIREGNGKAIFDVLSIQKKYTDSAGNQWLAGLDGVRHCMDSLFYEYLSATAFVRRIVAMFNHAETHHGKLVQEMNESS